MKDTIDFFADTYAFVEVIKGNPNYKFYLDKNLITTKLNLAELYYYLLKDFNIQTANKYLKLYSKSTIPISLRSIGLGMELKLKFKKERLSYTDCIGYALGLELGIKFLTGDQKFEDKPNVEFIK